MPCRSSGILPTPASRIIEKGLAENSLYLDFDGSAYQIPADVMEKYNAAVAAIKDGTIVVPSTIEEAKVWKAA